MGGLKAQNRPCPCGPRSRQAPHPGVRGGLSFLPAGVVVRGGVGEDAAEDRLVRMPTHACCSSPYSDSQQQQQPAQQRKKKRKRKKRRKKLPLAPPSCPSRHFPTDAAKPPSQPQHVLCDSSPVAAVSLSSLPSAELQSAGPSGLLPLPPRLLPDRPRAKRTQGDPGKPQPRRRHRRPQKGRRQRISIPPHHHLTRTLAEDFGELPECANHVGWEGEEEDPPRTQERRAPSLWLPVGPHLRGLPSLPLSV
mmetsp:Transcript_32102/g.63670  ORF Transcript_32102/g.63670 Transcript_32102/m.63670 type:complete len:250 (-) Transcript_32102:457-1206(-)